MANRSRPIPALLTLALSLPSALALADPPESDPAPSPTPTPALAGPALAQESRPTIVEWRYDGTLRDLEASPEETALSRLSLDPDTRARADAVVARRQAFFDHTLSRNLMLAIEIDAARKAEEKLKVARMTFDLLAHFEPLCDELPFREQIAAALDHGSADAFTTMLDDYDLALAQDLRARAARENRQTSSVEVYGAAVGAHFVRELERSFKRMESSGQIALEYILAQIQLSPEDAERARKAAAPFMGANPEGMTEKDYGLAFLAVAAHLTESQRQKLAEVLAGF